MWIQLFQYVIKSGSELAQVRWCIVIQVLLQLFRSQILLTIRLKCLLKVRKLAFMERHSCSIFMSSKLNEVFLAGCKRFVEVKVGHRTRTPGERATDHAV